MSMVSFPSSPRMESPPGGDHWTWDNKQSPGPGGPHVTQLGLGLGAGRAQAASVNTGISHPNSNAAFRLAEDTEGTLGPRNRNTHLARPSSLSSAPELRGENGFPLPPSEPPYRCDFPSLRPLSAAGYM